MQRQCAPLLQDVCHHGSDENQVQGTRIHTNESLDLYVATVGNGQCGPAGEVEGGPRLAYDVRTVTELSDY